MKRSELHEKVVLFTSHEDIEAAGWSLLFLSIVASRSESASYIAYYRHQAKLADGISDGRMSSVLVQFN